MEVINIKTTKKCVICKYWYDINNSSIRPRTPKINLWEYDSSQKRMCLKKNIFTQATAFCSEYICKLDIL